MTPVLAIRRSLWLLSLPILLAACDECAGTPSCHNHPEISTTGQFIERQSGSPVGEVSVKFVRRSGIDIIADTIRGATNDDGFFVLRTGSVYNGTVTGDLIVTPPAPYPPFTLTGVSLQTSRVRGDGENLGRLVVNPYLLLVGHVRDRKTLTPLVGATVTLRRTGGGRVASDSMTFTTDFGGQFSWEPAVIDPATVQVEFEVEAAGYPRTYVVPRELPFRYRDGEMTFVIIPVGSGLAYAASTGRRGSGDQLAGQRLVFRRTGGIGAQPSELEVSIDPAGRFSIAVEPVGEGTLRGELLILPPPAFPPETVSVQLETSDDDVVEHLGFFGYGAQVFVKAELRDSETGERLPAGTGVTMKRVGGQPLTWQNPLPEGDLLSLADSGRLAYGAPAADSGVVVYDMIVRHLGPYVPDTLKNISFPARYSDSAYVAGVINVRRRPAP